MALSAVAEVAMNKLADFLRKQSDKVDILISEFSSETSAGLVKVLDELKTTNPLKYHILSENFRKIATDIEPHLAKGKFDEKQVAVAGRRKRTTRRRKHRGSK